MWLLFFAASLQIAVILELVLNRFIAVVCNSRRSESRKLADGSFCGSLLALVMSVLTIPSALLVIYVNAYNSGVGQTLNEVLVLLLEILAPL